MKPALKTKPGKLIPLLPQPATTGYRSGGFNNWTISELLRPFQQTAFLAGMTWLPPLVMHSVLPPGFSGFRNVSEEDIVQHGQRLREFLVSYA